MSEGGRVDSVWAVDRIEGSIAVLVEDASGASRDVPLRDLPQGTREGDVLCVPVGPAGAPDWKAATADERLRRERRDEAKAALERLRRRDPGGDVKL